MEAGPRREAGRRASGPGGLTVGFRRGWRRPLVHYDAGHHAVVHHLKACGWSVTDLAQVGKGCPDLLIGRRGVTYLAEIKASAEDTKDRRQRNLRESQRVWLREWRGGPVVVLRSPHDVTLLTQNGLVDVAPEVLRLSLSAGRGVESKINDPAEDAIR